MTRSQWIILLVSGISAGSAAIGCAPGGVGDPCIPEDEYTAKFTGFGYTEANVESRSFQCETRVCIVNHFQGRVSCPYGQILDSASTATPQPVTSSHGACLIPNSNQQVSVNVDPQLLERRADSTVYCSCRCEGSDKSAKYCTCPSGYACSQLVPDIGLGKANLAGKYCIKSGTDFTIAKGGKCGDKPGDCDTPGKTKNMNP